MLKSFVARHLSAPKGVAGSIIFRFMNKQNMQVYEEALNLLDPSGDENILDIGCGNGIVLNMLAKRHGGKLVGIDISESIIKNAIKRNRPYVKEGRMAFFQQDATSMSFESGAFCKAFSINTVYFWDDLDTTLTEIARILKPSGVFVNALYTNETLDTFGHTKHGYKRFAEEELIEAGRKAGFSVKTAPIMDGAAYACLYTKE